MSDLESSQAATSQPMLPDLLFGLDDRPPWPKALLAAVAHLLAVVGGIATAPLLMAQGLQLSAATTQYLISSAFVVSGLATLLQVVRLGPLGSGLLSIQGTSFTFIGAIILAGGILRARGLSDDAMLGVLLGSAAAGALVMLLAGFFVEKLRRIVTPNVTGIVIVLLGGTLVVSAWQNFGFAVAGTVAAGDPAALAWLQGLVVVAVIVFFSSRRNPWLRMASIVLGLTVGLAVALSLGQVAAVPSQNLGSVAWLRWLPFPLGFDLGVFLILVPIFFVSMAESIGDLTATAMLSRLPLTGSNYWRRIRGGVMAGGVNSMLASLFGTFPNTTFSQNNGVIQLTGVACRLVGVLVALLLVLLGLLPAFSALFQVLPGAVLHSATGLLFAMIALAGWRLLRSQPNVVRAMRMLVGCTLIALLLTWVPGWLLAAGVPLPPALALLFGFPVASGALLAVVWEVLD